MDEHTCTTGHGYIFLTRSSQVTDGGRRMDLQAADEEEEFKTQAARTLQHLERWQNAAGSQADCTARILVQENAGEGIAAALGGASRGCMIHITLVLVYGRKVRLYHLVFIGWNRQELLTLGLERWRSSRMRWCWWVGRSFERGGASRWGAMNSQVGNGSDVSLVK
jgi:hypothetical protein